MKLSKYYNTLQEKQKELDKQYFTSKYDLYVDMDGVLTDFEKRFGNFTDLSPGEYKEQYGEGKFWELIDKKVGVKFWVGMPWMPGGKELWSFVKHLKPKILSTPSWDDSSKLGKRLWIKNNIPGVKSHLVPRSHKQKFANENSILIDDYKINIDEWRSKGGIGILHKDVFSTIKQLKDLGYE